MASVFLDFIPPTETRIEKLHIYEAPTPSGVFVEIEVVDDVGVYPNYITSYRTDLATDVINWFSIAWEDDNAVIGEQSEALQGVTTLLIGEIIDMAMLRDPTLVEAIVNQEAAATIEQYFGVDPYSLTKDQATYQQKSGLTFLTMARCYLVAHASGTTTSYTAGLITQKTDTSTTQNMGNIEGLIRIANTWLGRNYTVIALLEEVEVGGNFKQLVSADVSRSIIEVQ